MRRALPTLLALLGLACAGCASCGAPAAAARPDPSARLRSRLGTNLDFLTDWSTAMPFVDLMRTSREWAPGTLAEFHGGGTLELDERGWVRSLAPGQVARTLLAWDMTTHPAGRYVVLWEGEGQLEYIGGAAGRRIERESRPHRDVLDVDPRRDGPGIGLMIVRTDPRDPIRDIRVLVPGGACSGEAARFCDEDHPCGDAGACRPFEEIHEAQPFHPHFLRAMEPYASIRFMNWADANSTITRAFEVTWSDRTELEDARWAPRAPLEVMIDLANLVHAEPWITLPSRCDDDYARRAGALFRERLDPSLRVWVEYSNEVWNDQFPQAEFAARRGIELGLADDEILGRARYYARRSGELHRLFGEGLGDPSRMVRVLVGQSVSTWRAEQILDFEGAASRADVFAVAPYFGHGVGAAEREEWARMSLEAFFERAERETLPAVRQEIRAIAAVARARGLPLVAYEAGQHYLGVGPAQDDERIIGLFAAANRDPRMEHTYSRYLDVWREESGGGVLMHFVDCAAGGRYGHWGASEWLGQPLSETPKRRALLRFAEATSPRAAPPRDERAPEPTAATARTPSRGPRSPASRP